MHIYLSTNRLSFYLPSIYLPTCYLSTYLLSIYLPSIYLPTYHTTGRGPLPPQIRVDVWISFETDLIARKRDLIPLIRNLISRHPQAEPVESSQNGIWRPH